VGRGIRIALHFRKYIKSYNIPPEEHLFRGFFFYKTEKLALPAFLKKNTIYKMPKAILHSMVVLVIVVVRNAP